MNHGSPPAMLLRISSARPAGFAKSRIFWMMARARRRRKMSSCFCNWRALNVNPVLHVRHRQLPFSKRQELTAKSGQAF